MFSDAANTRSWLDLCVLWVTLTLYLAFQLLRLPFFLLDLLFRGLTRGIDAIATWLLMPVPKPAATYDTGEESTRVYA